MGSDVRSKPGAPVLEDFRARTGTPLVIDTSNGAASALIQSDTIVEIGARAGWNDYLSSLSAGKVAGANVPTWSLLRDGLYANSFSASAMNEVWINFHILHDYAPGTMFYPHIHWTTAGTNAGVVRWGLEYTFARGYGFESFPASTTVYLQQAATGTAYRHMIAEATEGNGVLIPTLETDGILMVRVFRDAANAADTCTDAAFGLFVDMHYQSDGMLTNERNRTFTKKRGNF